MRVSRPVWPVHGRSGDGGGGGVRMGNESVSAEQGHWAPGRAGERASPVHLDVIGPASLAYFTKYVRGNVHLRLSSM